MKNNRHAEKSSSSEKSNNENTSDVGCGRGCDSVVPVNKLFRTLTTFLQVS